MKDPSVSELLEKVARDPLENFWRTKLQNVLEASIENVKSLSRQRRRFRDVSSDTLSETDKEDAGLVPSRDGNRIQVTGERESGKLASGLQQIKRFLSQRGGTSNEANNDELATGVLQYWTSVFHGAHPQSSMSLRNSRELRTIAECIDALLAGDLPHFG